MKRCLILLPSGAKKTVVLEDNYAKLGKMVLIETGDSTQLGKVAKIYK